MYIWYRSKNKRKKIPSGRSKTVYTRAVEAVTELETIKSVNDYTSYGYGSLKRPRLNVWTRHQALHSIPIFNTSDVRKWSIQEVATFVERVVSNNYTNDDQSLRINIPKYFIDHVWLFYCYLYYIVYITTLLFTGFFYFFK